VKKQYRS